VQGELVASTDRPVHDLEVLTTVDTTRLTRDENNNDDEGGLSPPASTEVDDVDGGDFECLTDDEGLLHPQPLDYCDEEVECEEIEEYDEEGAAKDWSMDVDAAGGIKVDARENGPVSLPAVADSDTYWLP
jgi:hypothetical protein